MNEIFCTFQGTFHGTISTFTTFTVFKLRQAVVWRPYYVALNTFC